MQKGDKIIFTDDLGNKYQGTITDIFERNLPDGSIRRNYYIEENNRIFLTDANMTSNVSQEIKKCESEQYTGKYWNWHRQDILKDLYIKHAERKSNYREFIEDAMNNLNI